MSLSKSEVTPERRWSLPLSWQTIGSPIHPTNLIFPSVSNCVNKVPKVFTAMPVFRETFSRNLFVICLSLHLLLCLLNYYFSALCFWFMSDWTSLLFRLDVTSEPSISLFPSSLEADRTMFFLLTGSVSFSGSPELKYLLTSSQLKVKNVEMLFYLAFFFHKNIIFILLIVQSAKSLNLSRKSWTL